MPLITLLTIASLQVPDSLLLDLKYAQADSAKCKALLEIGYYWEAVSLDSALVTYDQALKWAEQGNYVLGKAKAIQYKGIVYTELGEYGKSINANLRALPLYSEVGYDKGVASTLNNLGNAYLFLAEYDKAIDYYLKAKPIFTQSNNDLALVTVCGNLCECYRELGEYDAMLQAARESFVHANNTGDPFEIANSSVSFGTALSLNGKQDSALHYLQMAHTRALEVNDPALLFYVLHDLSDQSLKAGQLTQALQLADSCSHYANASQRSYLIISSELIQGRVDQSLNQLDLAHAHYSKGLELAKLDNALELQRDALDLLARLAEQRGLWNEAVRFRNDWMVLNDSIFNTTKSRQIAEMRTLYETAEAERLLNEERIAGIQKDETIYKRSITLIILGLIVCIVLVIAAFLLKNNRQKRRIAEQEAQLERERNASLIVEQEGIRLRSLLEGQESERQRLGRDLHDGLGGMMTAIQLQLTQLSAENQSEEWANLQSLVKDTAKEIRQTSHDLFPEGLDKLGLAGAIEHFCNRMNAASLKVTFELIGDPFSMGSTADSSIYRIAQELVNNAAKHAEATVIHVGLQYHMSHFTLNVEDDGKGLLQEPNGHGFDHIRSRVTWLKGELDVYSQPGKGTSITVQIPVRNV